MVTYERMCSMPLVNCWRGCLGRSGRLVEPFSESAAMAQDCYYLPGKPVAEYQGSDHRGDSRTPSVISKRGISFSKSRSTSKQRSCSGSGRRSGGQAHL